MPRANVYMKSTRMISVLHPWELVDWHAWLQERKRNQIIQAVCDDKGNQYLISVYEVECVELPNVQEF
jgi:hypothetical protein